MEESSPRHTTNPNTMKCLEVASEESDSGGPPSPRRQSMSESIRKSFQMFTTVKLDESDEEGEQGAEGADEQGEDNDNGGGKGPFRFFFCCS
jgi:hypothetical protein